MFGLVTVFLHLEWGLVLLDVWLDYSLPHIQIDVKEVHRFNVCRDSNVETIMLEDPTIKYKISIIKIFNIH